MDASCQGASPIGEAKDALFGSGRVVLALVLHAVQARREQRGREIRGGGKKTIGEVHPQPDQDAFRAEGQISRRGGVEV